MKKHTGPPADVLNSDSASDVLAKLDRWNREIIGDAALYRAYICPNVPRRGLIDVQRSIELLRDPPRTRSDGWCIWNLSVSGIQAGAKGVSSGDHEVILLNNGYMEFRHPVRDEGSFQWRQSSTEAAARPWLYPYPVIEFPINFYELARQIYAQHDYAEKCVAGYCYYNIAGFSLRPGHPSSRDFMSEQAVYDEDDFCTSPVPVPNAEKIDVDWLVYQLTQELYGRFGFGADKIPLFDEDHHFQP